MGTYIEVKGDLLAMAKRGLIDIIAHGCNCQKTMGAGIALQIKKQFPKAYNADKLDYRDPLRRFGDFTYALEDKVRVFNLYTQFYPGKNFDISAFRVCLKKLAALCDLNDKIGLPLIGCGIGGGDWQEVKTVIQEELDLFNVTVVIYSQQV